MNPTANVTWPQVELWLKSWSRLLLNILATLTVLGLICRAIWYGGDWVANISFLIIFFICLITGMMCNENKTYVNFCRHVRIWRQILLMSTLLVTCSMVGWGGSGYWINVANGESTFSRYFLFTPPWPQPIYYVSQQLDQGVRIDSKTSDGVPLQCTIYAKGIVLDERDPQRLERNLVELTASAPPEPYIASALIGALAKAAETVLVSKTSEEISRQGQFLIPYKIGTPVGDTLSRLMLRWSKGEVTFKCKVPFES